METAIAEHSKRRLVMHSGGVPNMAQRPSLRIRDNEFNAARSALARDERARAEYSADPSDFTRANRVASGFSSRPSLKQVLPGLARSEAGTAERPGIGVSLLQNCILRVILNCTGFMQTGMAFIIRVNGIDREPVIQDGELAREGAL